MARINVEECWWSDPRRMKLILKIGFEADSAALNLWRLAQEFWLKSRALIPLDVFQKTQHHDVMIDCGLAVVRDRSVYVRGSSEHLEWINEKREQAKEAGKKSAESRKLNHGSAQPKGGKQDKKKIDSNENRTEVNGIEPSISISSSLSNSLSNSNNTKEKNHEGLKSKKFNSKDLPDAALLWNQHCGKLTPIVGTSRAWNEKSKIILDDFGEEKFVTGVIACRDLPFLNGGAENGWHATFSWLLNEENLAKVLSGDYDKIKTKDHDDIERKAKLDAWFDQLEESEKEMSKKTSSENSYEHNGIS